MEPQPGPSSSRLQFPPPDIIVSLVGSYFIHSNIYYPVLHRPTFQRSLDQGLHQRDREFGCLLLVVCAIGARFSDHPYVSDITAESTNNCMIRWLSQTREVMKKPFTSPATLFEVQYYCVSRLQVRISDAGAHVESPSFPAVRNMSGRISPTDEVDHSWNRYQACQERWGKPPKDVRGQTYNRGRAVEACLLVIAFLDLRTSHRTKLLTIHRRVLLNEERYLSSSLGRPCCVKAEE